MVLSAVVGVLLLVVLVWYTLDEEVIVVARSLTRFEHARLVSECAKVLRILKGQPTTLSNSNHAFGLARLDSTRRLNLRCLNGILGLDSEGNVDFGGACTIEALLGYLQRHGRTLPVIPDMKHLNMGGIVSGIGGGSGSWREGAFHDALIDCDVLLGDSSMVYGCSPSKRADLFHALPGSLGTLGYLTRMKMRTVPLQRYVHTRNVRCSSLREFLDIVREEGEKADFVDGTAFAADHIVCVLGYKSDTPAATLDNFVNHRIYWKALKDTGAESRHCMRLMDYIYRWETDLYYTSANADVPSVLKVEALRRLVPRQAVPWIKQLAAWAHPVNIDNVCVDILIPLDNAESFYSFYCREIGLFPMYLCPGRSRVAPGATFWTGQPMLDFGIAYGVLPGNDKRQLQYRALLEREMLRQKGRKLPYTRQGLSKSEFWQTRGGQEAQTLYDKLRKKYCAIDQFPDIFEKLK